MRKLSLRNVTWPQGRLFSAVFAWCLLFKAWELGESPGPWQPRLTAPYPPSMPAQPISVLNRTVRLEVVSPSRQEFQNQPFVLWGSFTWIGKWLGILSLEEVGLRIDSIESHTLKSSQTKNWECLSHKASLRGNPDLSRSVQEPSSGMWCFKVWLLLLLSKREVGLLCQIGLMSMLATCTSYLCDLL